MREHLLQVASDLSDHRVHDLRYHRVGLFPQCGKDLVLIG
jgi:hypothetical protein